MAERTCFSLGRGAPDCGQGAASDGSVRCNRGGVAPVPHGGLVVHVACCRDQGGRLHVFVNAVFRAMHSVPAVGTFCMEIPYTNFVMKFPITTLTQFLQLNFLRTHPDRQFGCRHMVRWRLQVHNEPCVLARARRHATLALHAVARCTMRRCRRAVRGCSPLRRTRGLPMYVCVQSP